MTRRLSPVAALVNRLIPGIRHPWLLAIVAGLFAIDLVVPDPIPLLDEVVLAALTFLLASWRTRTEDERPPPRDVTPADDPPALDRGDDESIDERGS
jgi:hypothetical protein